MPDMREISDRCNTRLCKGVCCTFLTFNYDRRLDEDFKSFLILHGIEIKETFVRKHLRRIPRTYLKLPLMCKAFDQETFKCKIYKDRPRWCRLNPTRESPFIPKSSCSVLTPQLTSIPNKEKEDAKPKTNSKDG